MYKSFDTRRVTRRRLILLDSSRLTNINLDKLKALEEVNTLTLAWLFLTNLIF